MTDVIIQHLVTEQRVRIKCRDVIQKIAIYKDRLAVSFFFLYLIVILSVNYQKRQKIFKKIDLFEWKLR